MKHLRKIIMLVAAFGFAGVAPLGVAWLFLIVLPTAMAMVIHHGYWER